MRLFIQLALSPNKPSSFFLSSFSRSRHHKTDSKYLPKYELFVSTQKIARGSITLSSLPSNNPLLFKFIHVEILLHFLLSYLVLLSFALNSKKVDEHFNQTFRSAFVFLFLSFSLCANRDVWNLYAVFIWIFCFFLVNFSFTVENNFSCKAKLCKELLWSLALFLWSTKNLICFFFHHSCAFFFFLQEDSL